MRRSAGKVATALAALDSAAASALLRAQLGDTSSLDWTVKKETVGKLKTQHFRVKLKKKATGRPNCRSASRGRRWTSTGRSPTRGCC